MRAIIVVLFCVLCLLLPGNAWPPQEQNSNSLQETFLINGTVVIDGPVVQTDAASGRRIWALQVDAKGNVLRTFTVSKAGVVESHGPSAVTDGNGKFTMTVPRDYALSGKKGVRQVALCFDPGRVVVGREALLVDVTSVKSVYEAKMVLGFSGIKIADAGKLKPGTSFKLYGHHLTLSSLIVNADGSLAWNSVTTTVNNGKPVQWEAVVESGWVVGYRMVNADLASLQGQQIAVPSLTGEPFLGTVEGERILAGKGIPLRSDYPL